tara:strand:+ start:68 stop:376 length:309 start_codon:yes stop_codon:yes gene_type:complete
MKTEELLKRIEDAMTEEERKLHNKVHTIKHLCMSRVESLFVQHYHDAGIDDLPKLVEKCNGTTDIDFFIDNIIYDLVKTEHIRLRDEDREDREKMKRWRNEK